MFQQITEKNVNNAKCWINIWTLSENWKPYGIRECVISLIIGALVMVPREFDKLLEDLDIQRRTESILYSNGIIQTK